MKLEVHQADKSDVLQNIVKLHPDKIEKSKFKKNRIVKITCNGGKPIYAWLRAIDITSKKWGGVKENWICIEDDLRTAFDIKKIRDSHEFEIKKAHALNYYGTHPNPLVNLVFWISILSLLLGLLSLLITFFQIIW